MSHPLLKLGYVDATASVYGRNTSWSLCPPLPYTLFSASELAAAGAATKAELKAIRKKFK